MKFVTLILSLIGLSTASASTKLSDGEVWSYKARAGEEKSTITILKVEKYGENSVAHIRIENIRLKFPEAPNGFIEEMPNAPIFEATLIKSLIKKIKILKSTPDFSDGYSEWKRAKGGVYNISPAEIISLTEKNINSQSHKD